MDDGHYDSTCCIIVFYIPLYALEISLGNENSK